MFSIYGNGNLSKGGQVWMIFFFFFIYFFFFSEKRNCQITFYICHIALYYFIYIFYSLLHIHYARKLYIYIYLQYITSIQPFMLPRVILTLISNCWLPLQICWVLVSSEHHRHHPASVCWPFCFEDQRRGLWHREQKIETALLWMCAGDIHVCLRLTAHGR